MLPRSVLRALIPRLPRPAAVPRLPAVPRVRTPPPGRWVHGIRPAGGRTYDVYLPARLRRRTKVPLVMLLHGCTQTPAEFADASRFTTVADRNCLVLVLPHQESRHHPQRCWRWYEAAHQRRGAGEPAVLATVLRQVTAEQSRWRIDPRRVYVAGLSAGGAMALTLAATYPDLVAAVGVHSAPAYRSAVHGGQAFAAMAARRVPPGPEGGTAMSPVLVVQGSGDRVVNPANGDRVADQWLDYTASSPDAEPVVRSRTDSGRTRDGRGWTRVRWYAARNRRVLEYWRIDDLAHAWSGGRPEGSFSDPRGPRAATLMWGFFRTHRLAPAAADRRAAGA
ncbi:extracellular catalytic domain type 1 short-chain-length polyhydroxyalkanoate depolymerase [Pseudonocardia saturnea]